MEIVISEHLRNEVIKKFLLLKLFVSFKNNDNNIVYANNKYAKNILFIDKYSASIILRNQTYTFDIIDNRIYLKKISKHGFTEIRIQDNENNFRALNHIDNAIRFEFKSDDRFFSYSNLNEFVSFIVTDTLDSKTYSYLFEISHDNKISNLHIRLDNHPLVVNSVTNLIIKEINNRYRKSQPKKDDLIIPIIEFHSDKSLKKFGILLNNKKESFSYDSDDSGNIEISFYTNDKLNGYYFNSKTKEQGYYEHGIKVGFWKEQSRIINYDRNKIFFLFPIFPL